MNWKVGMKARLKYVRGSYGKCSGFWRAGLVVTITAIGRYTSPASGAPCDCELTYDGKLPETACGVLFDQLEPLTPDLGSWDEIARSTGWHPTKQGAPA